MITTFPSALKEAIRAELLDLHTSMPGTISSFDPVNQTVDVQIDLKIGRQVEGAIVTEPIALLKEVPISYPRANDYAITFPIKPGDTCELRFMERSLDNWLIDGGIVDTEDYRHHSLSDAIAFVGLWDRTNLIKDYNAEQPEFRTGDAKRKVWLDDDPKKGHVEMVDLDNNSRILLKANGEVRLANDKVKTHVEIYPDTTIVIQNPKGLHQIDSKGSILQKNKLVTRQMSDKGDITDKTLLAKNNVKRTGAKSFSNILAKQLVSASGSIDYKTVLNKFKMSPGGSTTIGNPSNKLKLGTLRSSLGNSFNKVKIDATIATLGNKLSSVVVLPAMTLLKDSNGVVTPKLVLSLLGAVKAIADSLGLDIMTAITNELTNIKDVTDSLPEETEEEEDSFASVEATIETVLVDNNVDLSSKESVDVLELSRKLDKEWDKPTFETLNIKLQEMLDV